MVLFFLYFLFIESEIPRFFLWLWLLVLVWYWYGKKFIGLCGCSKYLSFKSFASKHAESLESMMSVSYKANLLVGDRTKTKWEGHFSSSSYNGQSTRWPCLSTVTQTSRVYF